MQLIFYGMFPPTPCKGVPTALQVMALGEFSWLRATGGVHRP